MSKRDRNRLKLAIEESKSPLKLVPPPGILVDMPEREEFVTIKDIIEPVVESSPVHFSHGLGYSSKSMNFGGGKLPLYGYRSIPGSRNAMEERL